jgi:hypothetical protein
LDLPRLVYTGRVVEPDREIAAMTDDFHHKNVGIVAAVIGGIVLVLGLGGLFLHLA